MNRSSRDREKGTVDSPDGQEGWRGEISLRRALVVSRVSDTRLGSTCRHARRISSRVFFPNEEESPRACANLIRRVPFARPRGFSPSLSLSLSFACALALSPSNALRLHTRARTFVHRVYEPLFRARGRGLPRKHRAGAVIRDGREGGSLSLSLTRSAPRRASEGVREQGTGTDEEPCSY